MNFNQLIASTYKVVTANQFKDQLKDEAAVKAAMQQSFEKEWVNYGDMNPVDHGGHFLRLDGDSVEIVETGDYEPKGKTVFLIRNASVSASDIAYRGASLSSYVGGTHSESLKDLVSNIILGWIFHQGGDSDPLEVEVETDTDDENYNEDAEKVYWSALERFGIKENEV